MPLPSELRQTSRTPLLQLLRVFRQTSAGSTPALKPKKGRPCGRPLNGGESRIGFALQNLFESVLNALALRASTNKSDAPSTVAPRLPSNQRWFDSGSQAQKRPPLRTTFKWW
jgi:hypothetical protein